MEREKSKPAPLPCQGVSRWDEPCTAVATQHCEQCGSSFCEAHFSDPDWHPCAAS